MHGTQPGPMVLGATQPNNNGIRKPRDLSKTKCYNCNQFGHMANKCPEPRKSRNPEIGKQTLGLTQEQEPQMAVRTETLGMTRGLYDTTAINEDAEASEWQPHQDSSIKKPRDNFPTEKEAFDGKQPLTDDQKRQKQREYYAWRKANDPSFRDKQKQYYAKQQGYKPIDLGKTQTLGMMRQERINLNTDESQASRQVDAIPVRTTLRDTEEMVQRDREAGDRLRTRMHQSARSIGHRGGAARQTARALRKKDERIENKWKESYEPLFDETGNRMYLSPEDRCIQGAREHENTNELHDINVRAYHTADAMNPRHKEPKFNKEDDVRTLPTNPHHDDVSWISCKYHWCETHMQEKKDNDCFPVAIPRTPNKNPYLRQETEGEANEEFEEMTQGRYNVANLSQKRQDQEKVQQAQQMMEEAKEEFKELMADRKYDHLMKDTFHEDSSEATEELECTWEADGLHVTQDEIPDAQPKTEADEALYEEARYSSNNNNDDEEHTEDCEDSDYELLHRTTAGKIKERWLNAWIDCRAKHNFIDPQIVTELDLLWRMKRDPYRLVNAEGQLFDYRDSWIDQETDHLEVKIEGRNQRVSFDVLPLDGGPDIILGILWLIRENPRINWRTGQVTFPSNPDSDDDLITTNNERSQTLTKEDSRDMREVWPSPPPKGVRHKYKRGKIRKAHILGLLKEQDPRKEETDSNKDQDRLRNIPKEYRIYDKLFKEELDTGIPEYSLWDHEILLTDENLPFQKIYPLNQTELEALREYLDEMLKKGYIRESSSSAGSAMFFVPKKTGKPRPVIDYREVNKRTIKDRTPLPLITELKDRLQGKKIFTALDLKGAYNLIRIKEGDE
ncbi:pol poly [Fusarium beomiforme]|uniref:Pol poly n=1 Tax=Fusarium beomiforme TaxID=44412 RepID=A0A9P5DWB4_9HYPO|nr:pol poly [Fusarium beomiforme]